MARVLISAIGTGQRGREYKKAIYKFSNSSKEYETSFVASALCDYLQVDKLYLVGTAKSMWEEVYNYFAIEAQQTPDYEYWQELAEKAESFDVSNYKSGIREEDLEKLNKTIDNYLKNKKAESINEFSSGGSHCFIINYGLNEFELWNNFGIFMRIGEKLHEDDEVYLDITHAFRSISLFNYITLDLIGILKFKKSFKLAGLYYGMLDASRELGYAPVVDLSPYYNLTLWARGAYNFINFGDGYILSELFQEPQLSEYVRNISEIVNINYIADFKSNIDSLNKYLSKDQDFDPVVKYMFPYLLEFTERFKGINSAGKLQLALAEWYFDNKRYAQGYICLVESIITRFLEIYRKKDSSISWIVENREKIKQLIKQYLSEDKKYSYISDDYTNINKIRVNVAHAGYISKNDFNEDIKKANHYLNNVKKYIFDDKLLAEIIQKYPFEMLKGK